MSTDIVPVNAGSARSALDVGIMRLCGRDLAVAATHIREVVPLPETLYPDFTGHADCIGAIVIRGQVIPVLDIAPRLGFPPRSGGSGVVLILRHEDRRIGLVMDLVSGLARIPGERVQPFHRSQPGPAQIIGHSFPHRDMLVGLIDAEAIFALPGVAHAVETGSDAKRRLRSDTRSAVLVSVADTHLAIDAAIVVATLPGVQLRPSPAPASKWAGVVHYLGLEVPVVEDLTLFDLSGSAAEGQGGAIIVVKLDEKCLLGIRIDRVRSIRQLDSDSVRPLSGALAERLTLFAGAVRDREGLQSLYFDSDALRANPRLRMLGALSREVKAEATTAPGVISGAQGNGMQQAYVIFRMGGRHCAAALATVKQIIPLPDQQSGAQSPGSALRGMATYNGTPLPLLGISAVEEGGSAEKPMVLIVEQAGAFSGLVVDKLENIVRAAEQRRPGPTGQGRFIQARVGGAAKAVPLYDLAEEVDRLSMTGAAPARALPSPAVPVEGARAGA